MIDWILFGIGMALGGGGAAGPSVAESDSSSAAASAAASGAAAAMSAYQAEDQTPTGKFTTATEIRPIMDATRASWVAVREYDGQDLVYVSHLLAWRCGMHEIRYAVNGGEMQVVELPPCHLDTAQPNAITSDDPFFYGTYPPGSVESVEVQILYDDLTTDAASFARKDVLMP